MCFQSLHFDFALRARDLLDQLRRKAQFLRHNHVLFMFGDDFRFYQPGEWQAQLQNLTKIFDFMNNDTTMHVQVRLAADVDCISHCGVWEIFNAYSVAHMVSCDTICI